MERITAVVTGDASVTASVTGSGSIGASVQAAVAYPYTGVYEVTPSADAQTLHVSGTTPTQDIIVNPIPSNYGLITWDGSTLMVS